MYWEIRNCPSWSMPHFAVRIDLGNGAIFGSATRSGGRFFTIGFHRANLGYTTGQTLWHWSATSSCFKGHDGVIHAGKSNVSVNSRFSAYRDFSAGGDSEQPRTPISWLGVMMGQARRPGDRILLRGQHQQSGLLDWASRGQGHSVTAIWSPSKSALKEGRNTRGHAAEFCPTHSTK